MSAGLLDEGFRTSLPLRVRNDGGDCTPLALHRWLGRARGADAALLQRAAGPTLDVGCGPGRLVAALTRAGVPALGIDIMPAAVGLTRRAGGPALLASVFDAVPDTGEWAVVVLADGNIGIGGDPVRLLQRTAELVRPGGCVLVELAPPGTGVQAQRVRLEDHAGRVGSWFDWAVLGVDAVRPVAAEAGLDVDETWSAPDDEGGPRWFASLRAT